MVRSQTQDTVVKFSSDEASSVEGHKLPHVRGSLQEGGHVPIALECVEARHFLSKTVSAHTVSLMLRSQ